MSNYEQYKNKKDLGKATLSKKIEDEKITYVFSFSRFDPETGDELAPSESETTLEEMMEIKEELQNKLSAVELVLTDIKEL